MRGLAARPRLCPTWGIVAAQAEPREISRSVATRLRGDAEQIHVSPPGERGHRSHALSSPDQHGGVKGRMIPASLGCRFAGRRRFSSCGIGIVLVGQAVHYLLGCWERSACRAIARTSVSVSSSVLFNATDTSGSCAHPDSAPTAALLRPGVGRGWRQPAPPTQDVQGLADRASAHRADQSAEDERVGSGGVW